MRILNYLRAVAIFSAGAVFVLAAPSIWRLARSVGHRSNEYRVVFGSPVNGLAVGDAVQRNGVVVGEVTDIGLTNDASPRAVVTIAMTSAVPVMRDSVASLNGSLITGVNAVEISGGTAAAGLLHKGDQIAADDASFGLNPGAVFDPLHAPDPASAAENKILNPHGRVSLRRGVEDLSTAGRTLQIVGQEMASPERWRSIDSTLANINHASERLSHTLEEVSVVMESVSSNRDRYYTQLDATIARLNRTLDEANQLFATSNQLMTSTDDMVATTTAALDRDASQMGQTLSQIDRTFRQLHETVQTVEPSPSSAIWGGWSGPAEPQ
jgi:phospholipid/cholesterol/gamma-HCH transport system substrate-binding protein